MADHVILEEWQEISLVESIAWIKLEKEKLENKIIDAIEKFEVSTGYRLIESIKIAKTDTTYESSGATVFTVDVKIVL